MSTSSSPSASPTPRWDSRSSSFISPRRLQELKQNAPKHAFGSTGRHSSDLTGMDTPSQPPQQQQQQQQRPASAHSRPSSFFSFRSHKQVSEAPSTVSRQSTGTNPMLSRAQSNTPPTSAPEGPRPTSSGGPPPAGANGSTLARSPSGPGAGTLQLHPEIRSVVGLTVAHAHKIYFSGPLVRKIERGPDGQRPTKDDGWSEVWAQLGGTTLSVWDMKLIKEASNQGKEVPPTYVNVTDAFVSVLGSVTVPAQNGAPPQRYANVLTLNTAGSNLLLFSCPNTEALISWATALRLCSWEKSRLEEIYTAHLIRITLSARDIPSTLIRGRMEGWARVRIAGQTDWKRVWLQVSAAIEPELALTNSSSIGATPTFGSKKKRMSGIFNRETSPAPSTPTKATVSMYLSHKPKDRRRPLLSLTDVTQAFAVYPERPELISKSTLLKIEARLGTEEVAAGMRGREGYVLVMPELEGGLSQAAEMLKWVVAIHDAFALYGRPQAWTWDPREPSSLMFAYPVGPMKDALFLDREQAESLDPRDDGTATVRSRLLNILFDRMRGVQKPPPPNGPGPQLPPLSFDNVHPQHERHLLTPITEKSSIMTHGRALSVDGQSILNPRQSIHGQSIHGVPSTVPEHPSQESSVARNGIQLSDGPSGHSDSDAFNARNRGYTQDSNHLADPRQIPADPEGTFSPTPRKPMETGPSFMNSPTLSSSGSAPNSPPMEFHAAPAHSMRTGSPISMLTSPFSIAARAEDKESQPSSTRAPSPTSMLTSPFSMATRMEQQHSQGSLRSPSPSSMLTSPFSAAVHNGGKDEESDATPPVSMRTHTPTRSMLAMPPEPIPASGASTESGFRNEAGALYYMQYNEEQASGSGSGSSAQWGGNAVASGSGNAAATGPREILNAAPPPSKVTAIPSQSPPPPSRSSTTETSFDSPYMRPTPLSASPTPERRMTGEPMSPESTYSRSSASSSFRAPIRKGTPMAFATPLEAERSVTPPRTPPTMSTSTSASSAADRRITSISSRQALGRKPSGARAPNKTTTRSQPPSQSVPPVDEERDEDENMDADLKQGAAASAEEDHLDAITALAYLQVDDNPPPPPPETRQPPVRQQSGEPLQYPMSSGAPPSPASGPGQFRSSFAPSKQAAERKARAEANQAAQQAAAHRPGRTHGRKKSAAWNDSSDEEDEDEEEEEDDADSDREPSAPSAPRSAEAHGGPRSSNGHADPRSNVGYGDTRSALGHGDMRSAHGHSDARSALGHGDSRSAMGHGDQDQSGPYSHARPPRNLPQIPGGRPHPDWEDPSQPSFPRQRTPSNVRPDTQRFTSYDAPPENTMPPPPMPGAARQNNIWSQVLDPNNNVGPERDTFVQMESQTATMTKAFTPHGLLSAGMQDKNDRSAKRQEEVARETGASLVNVPHKPPPPQLGLLGAISAHERDKQREGGIGATLTQREREKRAVEEKQRRMDEQQRQMEQMGSMYGGGYNPMMNPMMMNPMMMGMPPMQGMSPMMTGGSMQGGMNPMMGGFPGMFNPQHMFAAQQAAAQAYQQAMVQLSIAGSQAGGGESVLGSQQPSPMQQPMMTGQGSMMGGQGSMMGGMGGYDPRMSMMNPMMMMGMGGMGMGMGGMNPGMMPPQQSGNGSPMLPPGAGTFDARFGPPSPGELLPPSVLGGGSPRSGPGSGNASPVGRGSPLARAVDASSRPVTPKN